MKNFFNIFIFDIIFIWIRLYVTD